MRRTRPKHSELSEGAKAKANARSYARVYQVRGNIVRKPCAKCGATEAEKHHPDYSKPLDIVWLCRPCHLKAHEKSHAK